MRFAEKYPAIIKKGGSIRPGWGGGVRLSGTPRPCGCVVPICYTPFDKRPDFPGVPGRKRAALNFVPIYFRHSIFNVYFLASAAILAFDLDFFEPRVR